VGYNLYLHCHDCDETAFVFRGHEARCIKGWAYRHSGHRKDCAIDNGFAEAAFVDREETLTLPDDWWPE
jgi:hypothetical protein